MGNPTRLQAGLSTAYQNEVFYSYPYPDPFHTGSTQALGSTSYMNDFNTLIGTDYTVSGTSSTFALASGVGGIAVLTPGGTTTASASYKAAPSFQFIQGTRFWYVSRFKVSAVAGSISYYVGLRNGASATDGIWFTKAASTTAISLVSTVNSTSTTLVANVATAVADTYVDVGFYYDGTDLLVYANSVLVARVAAPTIGSSSTTLTNAVIGQVFEITPVATEIMSVDFVGTAQEVLR
jgi:hypothetical protein